MSNPALRKVLDILKYLAIYSLSSKMITFAIPKLLFMQFRQLHWESFVYLAEATKFQHMWSFFGRSYYYNVFIGATEFLIGALILFPRTRLIALMLSLGVCLNIFILNIEFEIDFAIGHITFDLALTLFLLLEYYQDIYKFFIDLGGKLTSVISRPKNKFLRIFPYVFLIGLSVGYFLVSVYIKNTMNVSDKIVGSYEVKSIKVNDSLIDLNKGSIGTKPMLFFEHNREFVLSIQDTLYVGFYIIQNEKMSFGFNEPTHFGFRRLLDAEYNETGARGISEDSLRYEINYQRLSEEEDYLNGLYN